MIHTARPTLFLAAMLLPVLAGSVAGQSRPLGSDAIGQQQPKTIEATVRAGFGGCPVEAMRAAWNEMHTLQAVAVEEEVLRKCASRADAITAVVTAHRDLNGVFAALLPPEDRLAPSEGAAAEPAATVADTARAADAPGLAALRSEVDVLQARVETLEGQPDGSPTLPAARAALAEAEERLAAAEDAAIRQTAAPVGINGDSPSREEPAQAEPDRFTAGEPEVTSSPEYSLGYSPESSPGDPAPRADRRPDDNAAPDPALAAPEPSEGSGTTPDLTGMLAQLLPGLVSGPAGDITLPEETLTWTLVYTARAGEGPWKAQVLGEGRRAILLPPLPEEGEPRIEWQSYEQGPFLLGIGDALPGDPEGRVIAAITRDGVMVWPGTAPDLNSEAPVPLTWHQGGDAMAPGRADWIVTKIERAEIEASEVSE